MKIEYTEGCVVSGLDIDEERFHTMSKREQGEFFKQAIDWYRHKAFADEDFQDFIIWLVEKYGDFEFQYHCDQCGDSVYTTTLEI